MLRALEMGRANRHPVYAETLEKYEFPVTQYLSRSEVKKEIFGTIQNSERICNDRAKVAISV